MAERNWAARSTAAPPHPYLDGEAICCSSGCCQRALLRPCVSVDLWTAFTSLLWTILSWRYWAENAGVPVISD
jgi:hypothetical protein